MRRAPLLEREDPRARLRAGLVEAASGDGRLVLVTGEAGVGKTALVERAGERRRRPRVGRFVRARSSPPRPLGPLADIAAKAGGALADGVGRGAPVHEVLPVLLEELAPGPTLMVIEDVQWADEATLDVIALLARRMATTRSLAVVTLPGRRARADHPLRLVLGGLAAAGVERLRLVAAVADGGRASSRRPPGRRRRALPAHRRQPVLRHRGAGDRRIGAAAVGARRRAGPRRRTRPGGRALLEAVAIVTGTVPLPLVTALGREHAGGSTTCLASGMLVESSDGIAFRHELARAGHRRRDRAVATAPALHRDRVAAAARPQGADDRARLAHHAEATGDVDAIAQFAPIAAAEGAAPRRASRGGGAVPASDALRCAPRCRPIGSRAARARRARGVPDRSVRRGDRVARARGRAASGGGRRPAARATRCASSRPSNAAAGTASTPRPRGWPPSRSSTGRRPAASWRPRTPTRPCWR